MEGSGLKPRCSDALPMFHLCLGLLPSVMKTREGAGRGRFLGQHLGKAPGRDSPFPVPLRQHQGLGKGQACLCSSAFPRASQRSHLELMQESVTRGPILAEQGPQPGPHLTLPAEALDAVIN